MSHESTLVTQRHFEYLAARTVGDDQFLKQLRADAQAAGIPAIDIAPEEASFLQILLMATKARDVVEVGTLAGYSAIAMARALPRGGTLRTIELNPHHADFARRRIAASDVAELVTLFEGDARVVLATFATHSADTIFLDPGQAGYSRYLEEGLRIGRSGGLVLVDNAFAFGQLFHERPTDREAPAVKAFNEIMAKESRLQSVIVPLGDGLWVGVKR